MSQQPIHTIRVGGTKASIWANNRGDGRVLHTTSIVRSYQTESGDWKETNTFLPNQLPELVLASQKAFEFIHLGTREASRTQGSSDKQSFLEEASQQTEPTADQAESASFDSEQPQGGFTEKVTQQRGSRRAR